MPKSLVRGSTGIARREFTSDSDPLKYLLPWEQKAAEIYVQIGMLPDQVNARGNPHEDPFYEALYAAMPHLPKRFYIQRLRGNPAWVAYVRWLKDHAREHALAALHDKSGRAVDNYLWAQEAARKAEDYHETRMAAGDHLDRIGATEKPPTTTVQVANIQLHSRNFTAADLLAPSPELEGEVVKSADDSSEQH